MVIVLMGYMGSGKSTIGQLLSKVLKFDFVDLDTYIQDSEGKSIQELFKSKGEIYFRKMETQYLKEIVNLDSTVVALGGGTPCFGSNMEIINTSPKVRSIYLRASIIQLVERLIKEKNHRPLISHLDTEEELMEFVGKHVFERSFFYNQAQIIISVDGKSKDEIIEDIVKELF